MRPFGVLALEMITMADSDAAGSGIRRVECAEPIAIRVPSRRCLRLWDESTEEINTLWAQIPPPRFLGDFDRLWTIYLASLHDLILYVIDNEIHHRGQGYVYLRALGIEPPAFYDRS